MNESGQPIQIRESLEQNQQNERDFVHFSGNCVSGKRNCAHLFSGRIGVQKIDAIQCLISWHLVVCLTRNAFGHGFRLSLIRRLNACLASILPPARANAI